MVYIDTLYISHILVPGFPLLFKTITRLANQRREIFAKNRIFVEK